VLTQEAKNRLNEASNVKIVTEFFKELIENIIVVSGLTLLSNHMIYKYE
jgi:hypothetical protein